MLRKSFLLLKLVLLLCFTADAAVFVVTSNADSGPGTLRQALLDAAANGSAEKDYINFNIADQSEAGRTIFIQSQLPDVSSNLVIDGSTQPGNKFGVSDTKIALFYQPQTEQSMTALRLVGKQDIEIYGLYIKNISDVNSWGTAYLWVALELRDCKNIQIGAAGKGNVTCGFFYALSVNFPVSSSSNFLENLTLKGNFLGIDADGKSLSPNPATYVGFLRMVGQINIGGTATEGNIFPKGVVLVQENYSAATDPLDAVINIKNNKFGVDYNSENAMPKSFGLSVGTHFPYGNNTVNIEDNIIVSDPSVSPGLTLQNIEKKVTILRNFIGTDKTRQKNFVTDGIFITYCKQVQIGSSDPADANFVTNCKPLTIWEGSKVSFNKNSFYCTTGSPIIYNPGSSSTSPRPVVAITNVTANSVAGTATPNAVVELFYSDHCLTCSPETYFASVTANANGNWQYTGPLAGQVIASATLNGTTSEFTHTEINTQAIKVESDCDGLKGSIKGAVVLSAISFKWLNANGDVAGNDVDLINAPPGYYKLVATNGDCVAESPYYEILGKLQVDATGLVKTNACGSNNGSITGLQIVNKGIGTTQYKWTDADGATKGQSLNLFNIYPGSYVLTVTRSDNCMLTYGPVVIANATTLNVDQSGAHVTPDNCGHSVGSITGITATGTGTLKYSWTNQLSQQVGTDKDLLNQPAGKYVLRVTDDTQCGPVYTTNLEIADENAITLDESTMVIKIASCSNNNGAITGIQAPGATIYEWKDISNITVSTSLNLPNAAAGDYTFTASNAFGCVQTKTYHVGQQAATIYPVYTSTIVNACYATNSGSISIVPNSLVKSARWTDNMDATVGGGNSITDRAPGTYKLYFTDVNGCESFYNSYTITEIAELKLLGGQVTDDECGLKKGSIKNAQVTGGSPPYTYSWLNSLNAEVGSFPDIDGLGSGTYRLIVTDSRNCAQPFINYTVNDLSAFVASPSANDIQVCTPGKIVLAVNNPSSTFVYRLYETDNSLIPIEERSDGLFTIDVKNNTRFFVSQLHGNCESARTPVQVTVGISAIDIANAFTPNADGINDVWKITGIENSPSATVQVFNRNGQPVFNSKGYATPFNGTSNGKDLPVGNYYYIINMGSACGVLSGTITIIR